MAKQTTTILEESNQANTNHLKQAKKLFPLKQKLTYSLRSLEIVVRVKVKVRDSGLQLHHAIHLIALRAYNR
jgi:hypothetical protein